MSTMRQVCDNFFCGSLLPLTALNALIRQSSYFPYTYTLSWNRHSVLVQSHRSTFVRVDSRREFLQR
jgi:hypothetical protein